MTTHINVPCVCPFLCLTLADVWSPVPTPCSCFETSWQLILVCSSNRWSGECGSLSPSFPSISRLVMPSPVTLLPLTRPLGFLDTGHSMLGYGASHVHNFTRKLWILFVFISFSTHTLGADKNGTLGFGEFLGQGCINIKNLCAHHQEGVLRIPKHTLLSIFQWFLVKLWQFENMQYFVFKEEI